MIILNDAVSTFVLAAGSVGYGLLASTKEIAKFSMSSDSQKQVAHLLWFVWMCLGMFDFQEISAETVYPGHQLRGGYLSLSPHQKWLLCAAPDGAVSIRVVTTLVYHNKYL